MKSIALSVLALLSATALAVAQDVPDQLDLPRALEIADTASPQVQLGRLRALDAAVRANVARASLGPQVNVIVGGTYQTTNLEGIGLTFPGIPRRVGPYSTFNARPAVSMPVLDLPLLAEYRAARARASQLEQDAVTVREQTRIAVIELYLQALQSQSREAASAARVASAEAILTQVRDAEQAGTASKLDVARADQQWQQEQTTQAFARRDREALITLLLRTIGVEANKLVALSAVPESSEPLPDDRPALVQQALLARPEMRSLEDKRRALQQDQQRAEWERMPKISFNADWGVYGATPGRNVSTYLVGGTMTIPVFTSGRIENEIRSARLKLDQWQQERRDMENTVHQEVARAVLEREAALRARQSAGRSAAAARESLELARLRYSAGLTTNLDVVTAQSNLAQAEDEEIRARYDGLLALARLARARGDVASFVTRR